MKKIKLLMNSTCGLLLTGVIAAPVIVNNAQIIANVNHYTTIAPKFSSNVADVFQIQDLNNKTAISYKDNFGPVEMEGGSIYNDITWVEDAWFGFEQGLTYSDQNLLFIKVKTPAENKVGICDINITVHDKYGNLLEDQNYIEVNSEMKNDHYGNYFDKSTGYNYISVQLTGSQDVVNPREWMFSMFDGAQYNEIYLDFSLSMKYIDEFGDESRCNASVSNIYIFGNENHDDVYTDWIA